MTFCAAIKKKGAPCGGKPVEGSDRCAFHDPKRAKAVAAGRQAGGKAVTSKPEPDAELKQPLELETASDVVAIAKDAVNKVRSGALTPKQGTAIGSLLSAALQGMKVDAELQEKREEKGDRPLSNATPERLQELLSALKPASQH